MYDNEEENGVIDNVESSILTYMIYTSLSVIVSCIHLLLKLCFQNNTIS